MTVSILFLYVMNNRLQWLVFGCKQKRYRAHAEFWRDLFLPTTPTRPILAYPASRTKQRHPEHTSHDNDGSQYSEDD